MQVLANYVQHAGCKYLIGGDFCVINVAVVDLKQIKVTRAVQAKLIVKPSA